MRLIPKRHELRYLSAEDQAYWKGYFQGVADEAVRAERRGARREVETRCMSLGEIACLPRGKHRDAEIKRFFQSRRAAVEAGRINYAA